MTAGFSTHRGLVRENNQDALLVSLSQRVFKDASSTLGLLAVADGMGGHLHGELASQSAINTVFAHLARSLMQEEEIDPRKYQPEVIEAVSLANRRIRELGPSGENSPGTTLTLALVVSRRMIVANVGDSRTFLYRGGQLRQVSVDHSAGRSQLTRDLGHDEHVKVDIFDVPLEPGDRIMLCSDGLWSMLSESDLTEVLQTCADPQAACATLVAHANQAGGDDNITVVIADIANQF
ncbi:MAG: protein phosphatase 2C domain-containing protein [Anaerolineae bacterium]